MLIAIAVVLLILVFIVVGMYNSLIQLRVQCDNAWSDIDVQLKRRYDLIPNLVETVKGYAAHEKGTLEDVVAARNRAMAGKAPPQKPKQKARSRGPAPGFRPRGNLSAVRAVESFNQLQATLNQIEDSDPKRAPLLQRGRPRSEHKNRSVPFEHHRRHVQFQAARVLRNQRTCRTRSAQSQFRRAPRHPRLGAPGMPMLSLALFFFLSSCFSRARLCSASAARELAIQNFEKPSQSNADGTIEVTETSSRISKARGTASIAPFPSSTTRLASIFARPPDVAVTDDSGPPPKYEQTATQYLKYKI